MKNYDQWKFTRYQWESVDQFEKAEEVLDGVHSVSLDSGTVIDIYVRNSPFEPSQKSLLTFFAGAVSARESKKGPFFSGLGIAGKLGIPVIAFADPGVDNHEDVNLAWYTGGPGQNVQAGIVRMLESISRRAGRELLLVGGSGGGFAVLEFSRSLGKKCSVFVWNAQTDITKYSERIVKKYFNKIFNYSHGSLSDQAWQTNTKSRAETHVNTDIVKAGVASSPARLLYLQNATDWHAQVHFEPFAKINGFEDRGQGLYAIDDDHVALVAHAASGHLPPPAAMLTEIISLLGNPDLSASAVAAEVLAMEPIAGSDFSTIPKLDL